MSYEDFNPLDEKYKQVSDLPEDQQAAFVDTPEGGFVLRSAMENYDKWAKEAKEANDGRSFWKKVLMMDRSSALDFAQAEARGIARDAQYTENFILQAMGNIIRENIKELRTLIDEHQIDSIISEDYGGRFPAEIIQTMINTIYLQRDQSEIPLVPLHSSRSTKQEKVDQAAERILSSESLGRGVIYVADYVASGGSSKRALQALERAKNERIKQGLESPDFISFITLGTCSEIGLPRMDEKRRRILAQKIKSELEDARSDEQEGNVDESKIAFLENKLTKIEEGIVEHSLPLRGLFAGKNEESNTSELFSAKHRPTGSKEEKELSQGVREHLIAKLGKKLAELYLSETA